MNMDYLEFAKLFDIRIPVLEHAEYYINNLKKSGRYPDMDRKLKLFSEYVPETTFKNDKQKYMYGSIKVLQEQIKARIDDLQLVHDIFEEKTFIPISGRKYVSIDIKEANWTTTKFFLSLDYPVWEEYAVEYLKMPRLFAVSKSLRQALLGQVVNPKKYDKMEKIITLKHLHLVKNYKVVGLNKDEIILELDNPHKLFNIPWILPVNITSFQVDIHKNFEETIRVDTIFNDNSSYKKLVGVHGDRFYIHYKTLILNEKIEKNDLLIKKDKMIFQWCGNDYKEMMEYDYIRKYSKPIMWKEIKELGLHKYEAYLHDKMLYYILYYPSVSKLQSIKGVAVNNGNIFDLNFDSRLGIEYYKNLVFDFHVKFLESYLDI